MGLPVTERHSCTAFFFSCESMLGSDWPAAVWLPAAIILAASGHWWKGLMLLVWGAAIVGQIDSFIRPYVISGRVKLHTLLVFFALMGGVKAFGVMGIFIGPVVLSVTLVLLDMLQESNLDYPTTDRASPGLSVGGERSQSPRVGKLSSIADNTTAPENL